ncbi:MAG: methionine--tRNA ligase [Candidatus Levybacteria bacterium CG10_big_fil_rev_8_21_14_0_10_36_7]|nr:MAG: methionine--tRNA ligase [Candidatus Levybacteria bacterium CG10_big_fil_rev_8_21_14_0_10_36_7]
MKNFYVTTAIPYVNGAPHIGHALEFVQADTIVRYHKFIKGEKTTFLSGSDENALKNVAAAQEAGSDVQSFVDKNALEFEKLAKSLNVQFDIFQKGSSQDHFLSSQKLWELCQKNGDIYKDTYTGLYCMGCETFYEKSELNEDGECFEHPGKPLTEVSEENYYFKLSAYQKKLIDLVETDKLKIYPQSRKNEVLSFLKEPLRDISISRSNERAKNWGVPVPGDSTQRIYVWFDALNIYQSGIGFGTDDKKYSQNWPADVQVIGKGIIRFHAVYWPAFLLSAHLETPKSLFVHGYFTVNGQKMSKSLGNVIDPFELVAKYGIDPVRYYLLAEIPATGDGDFSTDRLKQLYEADLANELGNLLSRVTTLASADNLKVEEKKERKFSKAVDKHFKNFDFNLAIAEIFKELKKANQDINKITPWNLKPEEREKYLYKYLDVLYQAGVDLTPFLPDTAEKINSTVSGQIKKAEPLFPRLK